MKSVRKGGLSSRRRKAIPKLRIKVGDTVKVIKGSHKGKVAKIEKILHSSLGKSRVLLSLGERKILKKKEKGETEQKTKIFSGVSISLSNVMFYSTNFQKASRINFKEIDGKKSRVVKKTAEVL